jgi:Phosphomannose isomerase type I, catalytic domain
LGKLVPPASTDAERLWQGDRAFAAVLGTKLLKPFADNLIERPWGGFRLREFKRLDAEVHGSRAPIGESFELAADDDDEESRAHPSVLPLDDGSTISLPKLLALHAEALLGEEFVQRYGRRLPLLPKLLDVAELLSVQAHPPGNTEVYVIVAAEPGATIFLGFGEDIDPRAFAAQLTEGRRAQQRLLELVGNGIDAAALQAQLKPWLARRDARSGELAGVLRERVTGAVAAGEIDSCLAALHAVYWRALDRLNAIEVTAGQVIVNANPARVLATRGGPASAEVHALGNPAGRAVLALEIRRPGPTFRAWDNVRFPVRPIDIDAALGALNLTATAPEEFVAVPRLVRPGVVRSAEVEQFRLEHLRPTLVDAVVVPAGAPHTLHALAGAVSLYAADGELVGTLARGESALVPLGVGDYRVAVDVEPAEVVKVELPPYAD